MSYTRQTAETLHDAAEQHADGLRVAKMGKAILQAEHTEVLSAYPVLDAEALLNEDPPASVVDGLLWAGCVSTFISEPNQIKTFLMLGLGGAVASKGVGGYLGRKVDTGLVVYASFESGDALGKRLQALRDRGFDLAYFKLVRPTDTLTPLIDKDKSELQSSGEVRLSKTIAGLVESSGQPLRVLIADTFRASHSGSENASEDVQAYLRAVRRLIAPHPGAAAAVAHHSGWQDGEGNGGKGRERGSSDLRGSVDGSFFFNRVEDTGKEAHFNVTTLKTRDGEKQEWRVKRVEVPVRFKGVELRTCVVEVDERSPQEVEAGAKARSAQLDHNLDLKILAVIRKVKLHSRDSVKGSLDTKIRNEKLGAVLARLTTRGLIEKGGQRDPYRLTVKGSRWLDSGGKWDPDPGPQDPIPGEESIHLPGGGPTPPPFPIQSGEALN